MRVNRQGIAYSTKNMNKTLKTGEFCLSFFVLWSDEMNRNKQMHAPVYEALERLKRRRVVPFDVPGHKRGRGNPELV